jgi:lia operon protein LiaG
MKEMRTRLAPALALLAASTAAVAVAEAQDTERRSLRGQSVEVQNAVGEIAVEPGSGTEVIVEIRRAGADRSALRVETSASGATELLRIEYPDERIIYPRLGNRSRSSFSLDDDGWRGRQYEVRSSGSGTEAWADLRILVPAGRSVRVRLGVGEVKVHNVEGDLHVSTASGRISSTDTRGRLRLSSGSGAVDARNANGDIELNTGSGSITASEMRGGSVAMRTGSGSVTASGVESPRFTAGTGSGSMRLSGVTSERVSASTGSGGVNLELLSRFDELRVSTGSGSVRLAVPEGTGARVEMRTGSGGISSDLPLTISGTTQRNHIRGTIGDGSANIRVTTGSGGVRLVRS